MDIRKIISEALFGPQPRPMVRAPPDLTYPEPDPDPEGGAYGTGMEGFLSGGLVIHDPRAPQRVLPSPVAAELYSAALKPQTSKSVRFREDPEVGDSYARAIAASRRSAIAGLGLDPRRTIVSNDDTITPDLGRTRIEDNNMWVNNISPPTITHEAFHNGIARLLADPQVSAKTKETARGVDEETIVRALMLNSFGDTERQANNQILGSLNMSPQDIATSLGNRQVDRAQGLLDTDATHFGDGGNIVKFKDTLALLEREAAEAIKRRRPGGPR